MTDIVERLATARNMIELERAAADAIDDIERLRADRDSWADQADARVKDCVEYISEIERLRKDFMDLLRVAANDATAFQAEIELLREQLQVCMRRWIPFAEVEFRKQVKEAARCTENGDPL